jgi:3-isopropylmalate dehydrogenase
LDLFANLRPIQIFPELIDASPLKPEIIKGTDILFYRELTGGLYFGTPRERRDGGETAVDTCIYTREEIRRIAVMAFEGAMQRRKKVTSVDKVNVLETSRLWRETVNMVAKDYPEVELSHQLIDSMTMKLISCPNEYDVVVTENLFGDILTDEASQITGSLGMLASASIGHGVGLFEPIHGSAPDIAGLNIANPMASVLSVAMLLRMGLGLHEEAKCVENAVKQTLAQGYRTKDIIDKNTKADQILGTTQIGQKIIENL